MGALEQKGMKREEIDATSLAVLIRFYLWYDDLLFEEIYAMVNPPGITPRVPFATFLRSLWHMSDNGELKEPQNGRLSMVQKGRRT